MFDFLMISTRSTKRGVIEIYPKFKIVTSSDLMIRGGDFYAIWVEERGLWSTDEQDALRQIDHELDAFANENKSRFEGDVRVLHMWDSDSGMIDRWHKYCQKQMRDNFHMLDEHLIFSNTPTTKKEYASKRLPYPLEPGEAPAYEKLIGTLYSEEERRKIEWAIGSVVSGESKKLQKFLVLYGAMGTGKSTVLNIIQQLFDGYYSVFDAKALGSSNNAFALESFKSNPLVAIQHDGDLSRIEDNTRLNSLVSHELMTVNEKFKSTYASRFKAFLFMGTNKPVKITDARSGLIRRLIDVSPSGNKLSSSEYKQATSQIKFELGAIAYHCREVYRKDPGYYDDYIPVNMLGASNDFYNFVIDCYHVFQKENGTTLRAAWEMYKTYCEEAKVGFPFSQRIFKEELKNYFCEFSERFNLDDGTRVRSYYSGFRTDKFENSDERTKAQHHEQIIFKVQASVFDSICADRPAQYATADGIPERKWAHVTGKLSELDTSRLHYVKVPENHIVIDFDIPGDDGSKSLQKNLVAAAKWPPTYAELSKSGNGIHLHYIYTGDPTELSRVYDDHIEVKVFTGKSSLRRRLTKCNDLPIAQISSGLPLKGEKKMINFDSVQSERSLRTLVKRNLNKEIHPGTKPSIDFIFKILEDAYHSGLHFDISDMRNDILVFAANSTHQSDYCIKLVNKMHFCSEEISENHDVADMPLVFYDVEVFPNLFLVNWKIEEPGAESFQELIKRINAPQKPVVRMINPKPAEIEALLRYRLIGFNCRRYDNHMLYARLMGYTNEQIFRLSQKIISGDRDAFFGEAYNISYTDVYDFASAGNNKSLKKLEIEMGIHHQELGLPWDQPVPETLWTKVAEYCDNDVIATEAAFRYLEADWAARQILADIAEMTVNDTTNSLTTHIIFGKERKPQSEFHYRDLSKPVKELDNESLTFLKTACPEMMEYWKSTGQSLLPYFPGYKYDFGTSLYLGEEVGEGGYVYAEPGMHHNVALLDIASMHPHSTIAEVLFGVRFTKRFKEIVDGRVDIKHEAWNEVNHILDGKLTKYIQWVLDGKITSKQLADALKTAINSVYGLTSASFTNPFRDQRNVDNIVAKRGALFMVNLKHEVQKRGYTVAHIKTDSIKIPDAGPEIIAFVMQYGKFFGYTFEHEATYDRMCLVNDAVYIAKYASSEKCENQYGYAPGDNRKKGGAWTATGTQFQVPYVFKKLFSREDITFDDMCETRSVSSALYLRGEGSETPVFIGRVGRFCPIKPGCGGKELLRESKDKVGNVKYTAVTGTKGYFWLESEMVRELEKENDIDRGYYDKLVDDAVDTISKYGDFEGFISDDGYTSSENDTPCKSQDYISCFDCPHLRTDSEMLICQKGYDVTNIVPF